MFKKFKGHPDFYKELIKLAEIHNSKHHDYCPGTDPLENFKTCPKACGIDPWIGVLIRMGDKICRLQSFAKKGKYKVNNESVEDTFRDLAVYSILALLCYKESINNE